MNVSARRAGVLEYVDQAATGLRIVCDALTHAASEALPLVEHRDVASARRAAREALGLANDILHANGRKVR